MNSFKEKKTDRKTQHTLPCHIGCIYFIKYCTRTALCECTHYTSIGPDYFTIARMRFFSPVMMTVAASHLLSVPLEFLVPHRQGIEQLLYADGRSLLSGDWRFLNDFSILIKNQAGAHFSGFMAGEN